MLSNKVRKIIIKKEKPFNIKLNIAYSKLKIRQNKNADIIPLESNVDFIYDIFCAILNVNKNIKKYLKKLLKKS